MPVSATCLDLLTKAFISMGVYAIGENISDADAAYAQDSMNGMLDQWSNEALTVFAFLQQSAPLVINQANYTIGPGGQFNMTRPLAIGSRPGSAYVQDTDGNNYPIAVIQQDDWNLIPNRTVVDSNYPDTLFYDPQFPLGIMNFYPVPTAAYVAFWVSQLPLADLASLSTPLSLPPGYVDAIRYNLADRMWPDYKSGPVDQLVVMRAIECKANVKRMNTKQRRIHFDAELSARSKTGTWDWFSGIYPGGNQ